MPNEPSTKMILSYIILLFHDSASSFFLKLKNHFTFLKGPISINN